MFRFSADYDNVTPNLISLSDQLVLTSVSGKDGEAECDLQIPDAGFLLVAVHQLGMLPGCADHLGPPDGLLQLHQTLLILVTLHQHPCHLHTRESFPLCHRNILLFRQNHRTMTRSLSWKGQMGASAYVIKDNTRNLESTIINIRSFGS